MIKRLLKLSGLLVLALAVTGLWAGLARDSNDSKRKVRPRIGQPADAELGAYLSTEEMASQADLIAVGRCVETRSQWFGRNLFTLATVSISEVVKGDQQSSVIVALPGGVDARRKFPVAMSYTGAPTMQPDEEVFLFLNAKERVPEAYRVVGYSQGKLTIIHDEQGQKMISRNLTRLAPKSGEETVSETPRAIPLSEFKNRIKDYVRKK